MDWAALLNSLGLSSSQAITVSVAVIALIVSVVSIVLGETRALTARRIRRERTEVYWSVSWPAPGMIRVTNVGIDEARNVVVVITSEEFGELRAEARRIRPRAFVDVISPTLAPEWNSIDRYYEVRGGFQKAGGVYRSPFQLAIYWRSPLKNPDKYVGPSNVTRQVDLDRETEIRLAARAEAQARADS